MVQEKTKLSLRKYYNNKRFVFNNYKCINLPYSHKKNTFDIICTNYKDINFRYNLSEQVLKLSPREKTLFIFEALYVYEFSKTLDYHIENHVFKNNDIYHGAIEEIKKYGDKSINDMIKDALKRTESIKIPEEICLSEFDHWDNDYLGNDDSARSPHFVMSMILSLFNTELSISKFKLFLNSNKSNIPLLMNYLPLIDKEAQTHHCVGEYTIYYKYRFHSINRLEIEDACIESNLIKDVKTKVAGLTVYLNNMHADNAIWAIEKIKGLKTAIILFGSENRRHRQYELQRCKLKLYEHFAVSRNFHLISRVTDKLTAYINSLNQ